MQFDPTSGTKCEVYSNLKGYLFEIEYVIERGMPYWKTLKADYYVNRIQPNANYNKETMQIYVKYIILTNNAK